jgi:hypothetical protein
MGHDSGLSKQTLLLGSAIQSHWLGYELMLARHGILFEINVDYERSMVGCHI